MGVADWAKVLEIVRGAGREYGTEQNIVYLIFSRTRN